AAGGEQRASSIRLLREGISMWLHMGSKSAPPQPVLNADRWVAAIMRACPKLCRKHAVWVLSFTTSAMLSHQLLDSWLDGLMPPQSCKSPLELTEMMVAFCRAGICAVAAECEREAEHSRPLRLGRGAVLI